MNKMKFKHRFGEFQGVVRIDGLDYTFDEYIVLSKPDRLLMQQKALESCVQANQRFQAEWKMLTTPVVGACVKKLADLNSAPFFKKRIRGRAAALRSTIEHTLLERDRHLHILAESVEPIDGNTYPAAVQDIFSVWEKRIETPQEKFDRLIENFDWNVFQVDDYTTWSAGLLLHKEILGLVKQLGSAAQRTYNQKCPWIEDISERNTNNGHPRTV